MSTATELKEQYTLLYDYMAASRDPKNMQVFGHVMTEMMDMMLSSATTVVSGSSDSII